MNMWRHFLSSQHEFSDEFQIVFPKKKNQFTRKVPQHSLETEPSLLEKSLAARFLSPTRSPQPRNRNVRTLSALFVRLKNPLSPASLGSITRVQIAIPLRMSRSRPTKIRVPRVAG